MTMLHSHNGVASPSIVVLAGPNGAGKSTVAPLLLPGLLGVTEFVNADVIAQGLSGFNPAGAAITAGRLMLSRARELADRRRDFAFETTLASRSLAPWIESLIKVGYRFHLVFLWLPSADLAVARVAERAQSGGHHVPEETVRRRYEAGLRNYFKLYRPMASTWQFHDNSGLATIRRVAFGTGSQTRACLDSAQWKQIEERYGHA